MTLAKENYREIFYCPIVKSSIELAEKLKYVESYDYGKMEKFLKEWMGECDGNSINRVFEYIVEGIED